MVPASIQVGFQLDQCTRSRPGDGPRSGDPAEKPWDLWILKVIFRKDSWIIWWFCDYDISWSFMGFIYIYIYSWDSYISIMVLDYVVDFCIPWWAIMIHGDMAYGMVIFCPWCYGISEHRDVPPRDRQPTYLNSDLLWPAKIGMYPIKREDLIFVFQQCGLSG